MRYVSLFSGIEAASVAWERLGWEPVFFSEIEKFPSAVLAHRFPNVPNLGDVTKIHETEIFKQNIGRVDLVVGGSPCQSFSVAGLRKGLDDPRGNLALVYLGIIDKLRPRFFIWENVPGVLSSNGGRDFGSFLGAIQQLGYGFAYRVLDAQYVRVDGYPRAVPQRRRRVFVVGCLGGWQAAAAVLFERESLSGHPAPRRTKRESSAGAVENCAGGAVESSLSPTLHTWFGKGPVQNQVASAVLESQYWNGEEVSNTLDAVLHKPKTMPDKDRFHAVIENSVYENHPSDSRIREYESDEAINTLDARMGTGGNNVDLVVESEPIPCDMRQVTSDVNRQNRNEGDPCHTLAKENAGEVGIVYRIDSFESNSMKSNNPLSGINEAEISKTLDTMGNSPDCNQGGDMVVEAFKDREGKEGGGKGLLIDKTGASFTISSTQDQNVHVNYRIRRLTPIECEKLQGFPPGWTDVPFHGKPASDGPRYKAIGNSMAVNVMRWIGRRIEKFEKP